MIHAYLNWGRWVANCPNPACTGASQLQPGQTTVICECQDQQICQHGPLCAVIYTVVFPDELDEIQAAVAGRPIPNRNWYPGEPIANLIRENLEHGLVA